MLVTTFRLSKRTTLKPCALGALCLKMGQKEAAFSLCELFHTQAPLGEDKLPLHHQTSTFKGGFEWSPHRSADRPSWSVPAWAVCPQRASLRIFSNMSWCWSATPCRQTCLIASGSRRGAIPTVSLLAAS